MSLKQLDRYVDYIKWLGSDEEVPFDDIIEEYVNSSSEERIKMLLETNEETRQRIKTLIDGGII